VAFIPAGIVYANAKNSPVVRFLIETPLIGPVAMIVGAVSHVPAFTTGIDGDPNVAICNGNVIGKEPIAPLDTN